MCQEEAFLNSLPSKFSPATTNFSYSEGLFDRKCIRKELGGALYPQMNFRKCIRKALGGALCPEMNFKQVIFAGRVRKSTI